MVEILSDPVGWTKRLLSFRGLAEVLFRMANATQYIEEGTDFLCPLIRHRLIRLGLIFLIFIIHFWYRIWNSCLFKNFFYSIRMIEKSKCIFTYLEEHKTFLSVWTAKVLWRSCIAIQLHPILVLH